MGDITTTVRLFGSLSVLQKERGRATMLDIAVPTGGITGVELASLLELPLDMIEGVFCNRTVRPVGYRIMPGDRVAFVPKGTPGPHRFFLGLYAAGREAPRETE